MKKLIYTALLILGLAFAVSAQTPRNLETITWDDSTAYSQNIAIDWVQNPVGILIPAATATASQTYTIQYYNPIDLAWYEFEEDGTAYTITVTTNRNTAIPMPPISFVGSTATIRLRAGTLGAPTTINSLVKFYIMYRAL